MDDYIPPNEDEERAARALALLDFASMSENYRKEYRSAEVYANEWWEERYVPLVRFIVAERPSIPAKYLA
jgi:hypothetical protein